MFGFFARQGYRSEPLVMLTGVLCVLFSALFFMQKFGVLNLSFEILDTTYMYLFAGLTMLAGITLLLVFIGIMNPR